MTTNEFTTAEQNTIESLIRLGDSRELAERTVRNEKNRVIKESKPLPMVMTISVR